MLEPRCLLSATLLSAVPTQSVNSAGTTNVNLGTYFDDNAIPASDTVVDILTNLGGANSDIPLLLTNAATPKTVANFLAYINNGEYADTIIHRTTLDQDGSTFSIIQGGGFLADGTTITPMASIPSEASTAILKNATVGTIAMALEGSPPAADSAASATDNWFINLSSNSFLDTESTNNGVTQGPFTAFGQVIYNGLTAANEIANLPTVDASTENGAWANVPVLNNFASSGSTVASVPAADLVTTNAVVVPDGLGLTAVSNNTNIVKTSISDGVLTLIPANSSVSGSTTVTVTATDFGGGTATSTFTVNVAPTPHLAFTQEPTNADFGAAVAPFKVSVENANGSVDTSDNSTVTLALGSAPAGGALGGKLTATAVSGVATFSNVTFNKTGAYTLTATDGAFSSATSTTLHVVPTIGSVDTANMNDITGWAADPNNPTTSINVQVVITGGPTQTFVANETRSDLTSILGSANHGFTYTTPVLSVGTHAVSVFAVEGNGTRILIGSTTVTSQNSLFDEHYYLATNPDVAAAVAEGKIATGYDHYLLFGQFEGRSPSPYWNESWYLQENPDVAKAVAAKTVTSGFMHYYLYGQYQGRAGLLYFNTSFYLATYPDVAAAVKAGVFTSAFEHYVLNGQYEGRSPMLYFSSAVYDEENPDILPDATGEPFSSNFEHFIEFGQYEGRIASVYYNEATYLLDNPDVAAAVKAGKFADGFQHWLEYGAAEGRKA
jgi:cyclophilin family peptidyl-prolyl cis-trans isomerase